MGEKGEGSVGETGEGSGGNGGGNWECGTPPPCPPPLILFGLMQVLGIVPKAHPLDC